MLPTAHIPMGPTIVPGYAGAGKESTFEAFKRSSFVIKVVLAILLLAFIFHPILSFVGPWRDNDDNIGNIDYDYHLVKAERENELPNIDDETTVWLDDWPDSDLKTATIAALVLSVLAALAMIAALVLFCLWLLPFAAVAMVFAALLLLIAIICYVAIENLGDTNPRGMFRQMGNADQDTDLGWGAWMAIIAMILLALAGALLLAFTLWTRSWKKMAKMYHTSPVAPVYPDGIPVASFGPAPPSPHPEMYTVPGTLGHPAAMGGPMIMDPAAMGGAMPMHPMVPPAF